MPRPNSDTPDFDRQVMGALDEPVDNGQQSQQQTQDHTQVDNNQQPQRQSDQPQQQQTTDQSNIDNLIARTDGTPQPNQQQQPNNNQHKPNQQQQRQQQPNTVLDDEGKPVVGEARRHFFKRKEAERVTERVTRENTTLKAQVQTFQQLHQQIAQSGLSAEEQAVSLALGKKLKANPVEAVKEILTTLQASGINISGAIGVNTIDTASIAQLIDQKLKPFTDRHLSEQQQQQQEQQLAEDVQAFFDEEPLAQMHAGPLNTLLQRFPTWSLDKAWSVLQVESIKNGLDINQPLGPQIAAKRNGSQRPNNAAHVQMTSPGRSNGNNLQQPQAKSFGHNARSQDIVLDAMAKAGLDISRLQ